MVKDKLGKTPGELGVSKFMECDIFPSVLGWVTGRASGLKKTGCCFVGGDDLTAALHDITPAVATTSIILCFNK